MDQTRDRDGYYTLHLSKCILVSEMLGSRTASTYARPGMPHTFTLYKIRHLSRERIMLTPPAVAMSRSSMARTARALCRRQNSSSYWSSRLVAPALVAAVVAAAAAGRWWGLDGGVVGRGMRVGQSLSPTCAASAAEGAEGDGGRPDSRGAQPNAVDVQKRRLRCGVFCRLARRVRAGTTDCVAAAAAAAAAVSSATAATVADADAE